METAPRLSPPRTARFKEEQREGPRGGSPLGPVAVGRARRHDLDLVTALQQLSSTELMITFEELSAAALVVVRTNPRLIARYYTYMAPPGTASATAHPPPENDIGNPRENV